MKIVREYALRNGKLICRSYCFDDDGIELLSQFDTVKLSARVSPDSHGPFLVVESGKSCSMSLALSECLQFLQTLKQMYTL